MQSIDLYRTASILIYKYGDEAAVQAALKVDFFLSIGEADGAKVWQGVIKAIENLSGTAGSAETKH